MRSLRILVVLLFCSSTLAWANLYHCDSPIGNPVKSGEIPKQELIFEVVRPYIKNRDANLENLKNKSPFLIYYAIDTSEAFMQYSVRYEVAKLIESCRSNNNVNFVGILNSLYVERNQIIVCKDRKLDYVNLSHYKNLDEVLKNKRNFIKSGDHTGSELGPMTYGTKYFKESNKPFWKHPLAHPDFLHDLIKHVTMQGDLFPSEKFVPFLNLKSHGSKYDVLSGIHDCQLKAKQINSNQIIKSLLTKEEIKFLNKLTQPEKIVAEITKYENILKKIDLGKERGVGAFTDAQLGNNRLNANSNGLGSAYSGLGETHGLGLQHSFGTHQPQLNWVLQDIFESGSNKTLGFLMLESCETNRDPELFHTYLDNIFGYYSAKKSLWYRNLNWWEMLERAEGSSEKLARILEEQTSLIKNIDVVKVQI